MTELSDEQKAILDFAGRRYSSAGKRAGDIRETFGISEVRYGQRLGAILEEPGALGYDAQLVRRLLRVRGRQRAARTVG